MPGVLQLSAVTESSSESNVIDSLDEVFKDPTIYASARGVKLKLNKVSRLIIVDIAKKIENPKPPRVFIEDKGREEENPSDPNYLEALQDANFQRGMLTINAYLVLGTSVLDLPPDMEGPDGTEWDTVLKELGLTIAPSGRSRYLAWMKYYALNDDELNDVIRAITRLSGVTAEEDVKEVQASFRGA